MSDRRVVITGLGVCAPNGVGIESYWKALIEGRSGVGPITAFDASALRSRIAGEVRDFVPEQHVPAKTAKRTARFAQLAVAAALEAARQAALMGDDTRPRTSAARPRSWLARASAPSTSSSASTSPSSRRAPAASTR
jgi:3-oxoacyl-(acyl-carrier-protein) synthase